MVEEETETIEDYLEACSSCGKPVQKGSNKCSNPFCPKNLKAR